MWLNKIKPNRHIAFFLLFRFRPIFFLNCYEFPTFLSIENDELLWQIK